MALTLGGTRLMVGGQVVVEQPSEEYERIYERFAVLLDEGASDADGAPLRLALDAMAKGERAQGGGVRLVRRPSSFSPLREKVVAVGRPDEGSGEANPRSTRPEG